jgi:paraquat-inducible protein A
MSSPASSYIACHECDLLQRQVKLPPGGRACCPRCGAELYREPKGPRDDTFAWALAAALLFVLANAFPIVKLELQGLETAATLVGAARVLWEQGMGPAALLVLVTLVIAPALEFSSLLYLVAPMRFGIVAPGFARTFRLTQALGPWQMFDVFMLGIIVAVVKLGHLASVEPGIGLWAFFGLMFASVSTSVSYDRHGLWERADALRNMRATASSTGGVAQ